MWGRPGISRYWGIFSNREPRENGGCALQYEGPIQVRIISCHTQRRTCWRDVVSFSSCRSVTDHSSSGALQMAQESAIDFSAVCGIDYADMSFLLLLQEHDGEGTWKEEDRYVW